MNYFKEQNQWNIFYSLKIEDEVYVDFFFFKKITVKSTLHNSKMPHWTSFYFILHNHNIYRSHLVNLYVHKEL